MIIAILITTIFILKYSKEEAGVYYVFIKSGIKPDHLMNFISRAFFAVAVSTLAHAYDINYVKILMLSLYQCGVFGIAFTLHLNKYRELHPLYLGDSWMDTFFKNMFGTQSAGIIQMLFFATVSVLSILYYILK